MKLAFIAFMLTFMNLGFAQHDHAQSNAKLAHDASHRLGKLVDTGKINESYINNLSSLEIVALSHTDHNGPAFKVIASVGSGANKMELLFNMAGKFLSNKVIAEGPAEVSPWIEGASSELIEAALHPLTDTTSAEMMPFMSDLAKVSVKRAVKEDGSVQAVVTMTSSTTAKTLQVTLALDGTILDTTILQ